MKIVVDLSFTGIVKKLNLFASVVLAGLMVFFVVEGSRVSDAPLAWLLFLIPLALYVLLSHTKPSSPSLVILSHVVWAFVFFCAAFIVGLFSISPDAGWVGSDLIDETIYAIYFLLFAVLSNGAYIMWYLAWKLWLSKKYRLQTPFHKHT